MRMESHKKRLEESLWALSRGVERGLEKWQRNIGFNTSAAMCDLLEMLLHQKNLIDPGSSIKHDSFKSENIANDNLPFDFPHKKEILDIMVRIERKRNALCYGTPQTEKFIQSALDDFNLLRSTLKEAGLDEDKL